MSEQAHQFLKRWTLQHVEPISETHTLREAVRLVMDCRADAVLAGVPAEELRAAAGDDMIRYMLMALTVAPVPTGEVAAQPPTIQPPTILERLLGPISVMRRRSVENVVNAS